VSLWLQSWKSGLPSFSQSAGNPSVTASRKTPKQENGRDHIAYGFNVNNGNLNPYQTTNCATTGSGQCSRWSAACPATDCRRQECRHQLPANPEGEQDFFASANRLSRAGSLGTRLLLLVPKIKRNLSNWSDLRRPFVTWELCLLSLSC
jgi:hypothetical protein